MRVIFDLPNLSLYRAASEKWNAFSGLKEHRDYSFPAKEICFSENAPETETALRYGEWLVTEKNGTLFLCGNTPASLLAAADFAFSHLKNGTTPPAKRSEKSYPHPDAQVGKIPLACFAILYEKNEESDRDPNREDLHRHSAPRQAAEDLQGFLGDETGILLPMKPLGPDSDLTCAFVIGSQNRFFPYGEGRVRAEDDTVFIEGNDIVALESGISYLCSLFARTGKIDPASLFYSSSLQERSEYEHNPDAFRPCYGLRLPDERTSFEEKAEKLADPKKPLFILAHRGEHTYYPENSLEANISAIFCGADSTELDTARTRDGVIVCMHDSSLSRTTDVEEKRGKNNLPDSLLLSDWSLRELRELRLLDTYGKKTPFLIPTLEEILCCAEGRIFVHIDKKFDYREEIFPLMKKNRLSRCLYLCNYIDKDGIRELQYDFSEEGNRLPSVLRIKQAPLAKLRAQLKELAEEPSLTKNAVLINDYYKYDCTQKKLVTEYKGTLRIASWMMWETDTEYFWQEACSVGFGFLMTNFPIRLKHSLK